jgi:hypothetical protein
MVGEPETSTNDISLLLRPRHISHYLCGWELVVRNIVGAFVDVGKACYCEM